MYGLYIMCNMLIVLCVRPSFDATLDEVVLRSLNADDIGEKAIEKWNIDKMSYEDFSCLPNNMQELEKLAGV